MTPEEQQKKTELEQQINEEFSQLQEKLGDLKKDVQTETDENKKQEKDKKIQEIESELSDIKVGKEKLERMTSLQEQELLSLKDRMESLKTAIQGFSGEITDLQNEKTATPKTYELLKNSETYNRLLNIISSNPNEFKNLKDDKGNNLDTPEAKLEYIFNKIRDSIVQFMKNKLGDSEKSMEVINNTIAPALEWNLMELLRDQGNETNTRMLQEMNGISRESLQNLFNGIKGFAENCSSSYNKFNQWINAIDYLSIHKGILDNPEKSEILTNPLKFQDYLNNAKFASNSFDPYSSFSNEENKQLFKIDNNQNFEFGLSLQEKQQVLSKIGNIQVVNNPKTTALITKLIDKPEKFLKSTPALQSTANTLLNGLNAVNGITKIFGVDVIGEVTKLPEKRSFLYRILDFVFKLIGFTGGIEGIVKTWRLDRLNLNNEKTNSIKSIYEKFKEKSPDNKEVTVSDQTSWEGLLKEFELTDLDKNNPSTRGDFLCLSIADNIDLNLVSPSIVKQLMGTNYIKSEEIIVNGKKQIKESIDTSKFSNDDKKNFAYKHINSMREYFKGKYNDLTDFFKNIHSIDDITICMTTALYADKDDIIEGVKANVFLPENYGVSIDSGDQESGSTNSESGDATVEDTSSLSDLTPSEKTEMENLVEQSKTANTINYLDNPTYKKYLNVIERDLKLPKYSLECICKQESGGVLYKGNNLIGSSAGAQGLFQFIPDTADSYMKNSELGQKYQKTFSSREEFLKDPLATAWAAGIMISENMTKYGSFQSALACYNRGPGNYEKKIGKKSLTSGDLGKLPNETKTYVENITKDVLQHNSAPSSDLFADLGNYSRNSGDNPTA